MRRSIQGYASAPLLLLRTVPVYTVGTAGWRENPSSEILAANFHVPLTQRVGLFTGFDYEARQALWAQWLGVDFAF
jgi:hypothetical protein